MLRRRGVLGLGWVVVLQLDVLVSYFEVFGMKVMWLTEGPDVLAGF